MTSGRFTFLDNDFENVFQNADLLIPGIARVAGVFYSQSDRQLHILSKSKDENVKDLYTEKASRQEKLVMVQKFRNISQPFSWIRKEDIPFELEEPGDKLNLPNLFSELENIILVLRYRNEIDKLYDLLLIFFNPNLGNFGLSRADKALNADNKIIIGHLLYHQFKSFFLINQANRAIQQQLSRNVKAVVNENKALRESFQQLQASYGENMINMAVQHLSMLSAERGRNYILSDNAMERIREFKGNIRHLPKILENALVFVDNMIIQDDADPVTISPYCLDFDSFQVDERKESTSRKIDSRESRAMQLLDKLERAARSLVLKNQPILSSKVGQEMSPPVSAPAITDALGKNKHFIRILLEKYPEKWETIRNDFKPLINQLRKSDPGHIREESA